MSNQLFKLFLILSVVGLILFFNYPSFDRFFLTDTKKTQQIILADYKLALSLMEDLANINLVLPDVEKNRIILLLEDDIKAVNLDNVAIKKILKDHFKYTKTDEGHYLEQIKFGDQIFLSDFVLELNTLLENARRISDISLSSDQTAIIFTMLEGRRLALESPPINSILSEAKYGWVYDYESQSYQARLADPPNVINLGLDLVGGVYLDVGVDQTKLLEKFISGRANNIQTTLYNLGFDHEDVVTESLSTIVVKSSFASSFPEFVPELGNFIEGFDYEVLDSGRVVLTLTDEYAEELRTQSLTQVIEIIRNRIDLLGVKEPIIQRRGEDSVVVQVPGQTDSLRIKELITRPANLEFRLVVPEAEANEIGAGEVLFFETIDLTTKEVLNQQPLTVGEVLMTGDMISDARVVFDQFTGTPLISMTMRAEGASVFGQITAANVGKNLAIVLDNKIKSYPSINQAIYGGEASITGSFSLEEATDLAIVLRSGALPVSLDVNEERVIGATLGEESIRKSIYSLMFGFFGVGVFMCVYYAISGVMATISLIVGVLMMLAILAFFGATLTLPGIAGIILTVGMAVDANILIFERIREELVKGAGPRAAIKQGFSRATISIVDSNFTTLMVAAVLFQFGTGPVKGFAITLAIGIITTLFISLVFCRWLYDLVYLRQSNIKKISI